MEEGDHRVGPAEAFSVQLEQALLFDLGDQVLLVGVAEGQEDAFRADLRGEPVGEGGGEGAVMSGEEPVGYMPVGYIEEGHQQEPPSRGSDTALCRDAKGRGRDEAGCRLHRFGESPSGRGALRPTGEESTGRGVARPGHFVRRSGRRSHPGDPSAEGPHLGWAGTIGHDDFRQDRRVGDGLEEAVLGRVDEHRARPVEPGDDGPDHVLRAGQGEVDAEAGAALREPVEDSRRVERPAAAHVVPVVRVLVHVGESVGRQPLGGPVDRMDADEFAVPVVPQVEGGGRAIGRVVPRPVDRVRFPRLRYERPRITK